MLLSHNLLSQGTNQQSHLRYSSHQYRACAQGAACPAGKQTPKFSVRMTQQDSDVSRSHLGTGSFQSRRLQSLQLSIISPPAGCQSCSFQLDIFPSTQDTINLVDTHRHHWEQVEQIEEEEENYGTLQMPSICSLPCGHHPSCVILDSHAKDQRNLCRETGKQSQAVGAKRLQPAAFTLGSALARKVHAKPQVGVTLGKQHPIAQETH